mmetsp:Transcript_12872/g.27800  ORF Transcript_12872/g.27800 Transcript_12872/m.27800 type:complete len:89 (+) Transcript_12872:452-718(+)|eukprot:6173079-Pleurochrysis_carterae.AAC.2
MHPLLTTQNNPMCVELIEALKKCHENQNMWDKLVGSCNEEKAALDRCFRAQKKVKTRLNQSKAREERERWKAKVAELEQIKSARKSSQ